LVRIGRRGFLGISAAAMVACAAPAAPPALAKSIKVYRSPSCGCCGGWVDHLRAAGFQVAVEMIDDVGLIAQRLGVPDELRSCHTGEIAGYFVEGHVPASDVERLLREKPAARGIAVPGMPIGSPGMEMGGRREPFQTLLVDRKNTISVFATH
jgi:hypothetical protein